MGTKIITCSFLFGLAYNFQLHVVLLDVFLAIHVNSM